MEYLALFFTVSASVKFQRKLQKLKVPVEALPVPRKLSSGCGIAAKFSWSEDLTSLLDEGVERIYTLDEGNYILKYEAD